MRRPHPTPAAPAPDATPAPSNDATPAPSTDATPASTPDATPAPTATPAPAPKPLPKTPRGKAKRRKRKARDLPMLPGTPTGTGGTVAPRAVDDRALWRLSSADAQVMVSWDGRALRPSRAFDTFVAKIKAAPRVETTSTGETIYLRSVTLTVGAPDGGKVPYTFEYFAYRAVDRGGFERVAQHPQTFVFDPADGQTRRVTGDLDAALRGVIRVVNGEAVSDTTELRVDGVGAFAVDSLRILETTTVSYRVLLDLTAVDVEPGVKIVNASGSWEELRTGRPMHVAVLVPIAPAAGVSR
jgi:hypothetical protein